MTVVLKHEGCQADAVSAPEDCREKNQRVIIRVGFVEKTAFFTSVEETVEYGEMSEDQWNGNSIT